MPDRVGHDGRSVGDDGRSVGDDGRSVGDDGGPVGNDLLEPDFWSRLFLFLFYAGGEVCYSQVQIIDVLSDIF